jgi:O-antigen/teichoic acid export membrane protein
MVAGTLLYFLINKSQLFFLQHYGDLSTVGIYNLGLQIGSILTLVAAAFNKGWQPMIYSATSKELAAETITKTSKWFIAGMLYLTMGLSILSGEVLRILARPEYYGAGLIIRLVAIASFFYVLSTLTSSALLYEKRADLTQVVTLISAGCNLILSRLLIPRWQMVGAALSMLISFIILTILSYVLAQRVLWVNYGWINISKIIGVGVVIMSVEWLLVSSLVQPFATLCRLALLFSYPVLLVLVGAFSMHEVRLIWSLPIEFVQRLRVRYSRTYWR